MYIYRIGLDPDDLVVTTVDEIRENPKDKTADIYFYEVEPKINSNNFNECYPDCHTLEYMEILGESPIWKVQKLYRFRHLGGKSFYFDNIDDAIDCAMKPF